MSALNKRTIIGNIVSDAVVRNGKNNSKFITYTVALNSWNPEEKTLYFDCADYVTPIDKSDLFRKGSKIYLSGEPKESVYTKGKEIFIQRNIKVTEFQILMFSKKEE